MGKINIKKDTNHLFIRLNNYEEYNYINEHKKVIDKNSYTWILKIGKTINRSFIEELIKNGSAIILKSPNKDGNKFYYCQLCEGNIQNEKKVFPEYYNEYLYYEGIDIKDTYENAYWFKIKNMIEMPEEAVKQFVTIKGNNSMYECAIKTRVVHMYVKNEKDLSF